MTPSSVHSFWFGCSRSTVPYLSSRISIRWYTRILLGEPRWIRILLPPSGIFLFLFSGHSKKKTFRGSGVVAVCMYIVAQGQLLFMAVVIQSRWQRKKNLKGDGTKVWQDVLAYSECVSVCTYIGGGILYTVWCTYIYTLSRLLLSRAKVRMKTLDEKEKDARATFRKRAAAPPF